MLTYIKPVLPFEKTRFKSVKIVQILSSLSNILSYLTTVSTIVHSPQGDRVRNYSRSRVATADNKEWTKRALTLRS
jgi:hypothetical protein